MPLILQLIRELAQYEKLAHEVRATESLLHATLFVPRPAAEVVIAEHDGRAVGFAVYFASYSTWEAAPGLYLEDLFVRPAFRGRGLGKALMMQLAGRCIEQGLARFEWSVLDWNAPSIAFYKSIGAAVMDDWKICRLSGPALQAFAAKDARP